jgi:hypothetical protein
MESRRKCSWCNEAAENLVRAEATDTANGSASNGESILWAHPHHVARLLEWARSSHSRTRRFLRLLIAAVLFLMVGTPLALVWGVQVAMTVAAVAIISIGILLVAQPIPTPQTIAMFGVYRATLIVRVAGVFLLLSVAPLVYFAVTYRI